MTINFFRFVPLLLVAVSIPGDGFRMFSPLRVKQGLRLPSLCGAPTSTETELTHGMKQRNLKLDNKRPFDVGDSSPAEDTSTQYRKEELTLIMEDLIQPRSYPLFLTEKIADIVEFAVAKTRKTLKSDTDGSSSTKERVVVLGTGWGAAAFLKDIDTDLYDVTVVSPRNFFLFTPMLAGASVGSVEYRSITEPIRNINDNADYLEATATGIDPEASLVCCQSVACEGNSCDINDFELKYDRLVVAVGAQSNTFGIPGVREHCSFLKEVDDARRIRAAIVNCFERANIPGLTDDERVGALTFAIIGAGPTGIEFAAELRDFIEEDGPKYYPNLLRYVRIKVFSASSTVLVPFDEELQQEAIRMFRRPLRIKDSKLQKQFPDGFDVTELCLGCRVKEVKDKTMVLSDDREFEYGLSVWAAGNGPLPITLNLIEALGDSQAQEQAVAHSRVAVDPWLRAKGSVGKILSFGDCSCITSGQLPATAQVASQQGEYLAHLLNKKYQLSPSTVDNILPPPVRVSGQTETSFSDTIDEVMATPGTHDFARPFQFWNLGILAYTGGDTALAQVAICKDEPFKGKGSLGYALWRSVYLSKQLSWRNRALVLSDWVKRRIFGRDIVQL